MRQNKIWEYIKSIGIALVLALIIRSSVVQAYKIPSGSMIPTLLIGDYLLANKFIYGPKIPFIDRKLFILEKPQKGDIIIFPSPEDSGKDLIKRVIAVEGDVIEERDKQIFINGKPMDEPYTQHIDNFLSDQRDNFSPYVVPRNKMFVMGDNRDQSYDSRFWGCVDIKDIKGKAFILYWSWDSARHLPRFNRIGHLIK
jgi:signal peptidase I